MDQKQNQQVFTMLECGDIALSQLIEFAVVMFGMTRRGKTTFGHYLTGEPLRGHKDGHVYYKATSTTSKYKNAKIGDTPNSQTQIPNYFTPMLSKNQKITLIDCPGFQDSKGCHKIITNGYFNYRVFSKVKNMKFILVVKKQDLQNDASMFHKTLINFFDCFKNIENYLDDILNATCFVINKGSSKSEDNYQKLKQLRQFKPASLTSKNYSIIKSFIDNMVSQRKVYAFQQAKQNLLAPIDSNPLKDIFAKTKYWARELTKNDQQVVDMSLINFSIMKEIDRNRSEEQFWKQWVSLMKYFNHKNKSILIQGFKEVFVQIIQDSVSLNQQQCQFLQKMKKFSANWGKFSPAFQNQRKVLIANLFLNKQPNASKSPGLSINAADNHISLYWIRKMKVVEEIYDQFIQFADYTIKRNYEEIQVKSQRILKLIKGLGSIAKNKNEKQCIIPNYGYVLFRLFEEAKVFFLLFNGGQRHESTILVDENTNMFEFSYPMKEAISGIFQTQINELKKKFALEYKIKENLQPKDYSDILKFYKSITIKKQTFDEQSKKNFSLDQINKNIKLNEQIRKNLRAKQTELLLHSSVYYLNKQGLSSTERLNVIDDLNTARKNIEREIQLKPQDTQGTKTKHKYLIQLVRIMGEFLEKASAFSEARKCYNSINFVPKVLQVFQKQVDAEDNPRSKRQKLIQMGKYAYKVGRQDLGLQKLQQAYCASFQIAQFNQLAFMIFQAETQKIEQMANVYLKNMMENNIYVPLSPEDANQIQTYCADGINTFVAHIADKYSYNTPPKSQKI